MLAPRLFFLRSAAILASAITLVSVGLVVTGKSARAKEFVTAWTLERTLEPLDGSRATSSRRVVWDGVPHTLTSCTDRERSPEAVRQAYEELATRDSHDLPCLSERGPNGELFVLWTEARTGARKGVIIHGSSPGTRYSLLEARDRAVNAHPADPYTTAGPVVAAGLQAPAQATPVLTLDHGTSGYALVDLPAAPSLAAERVAATLEAQGFTVDLEAARDLSARGSAREATIPFRGAQTNGFAAIAPTADGRSRISYVVRREP